MGAALERLSDNQRIKSVCRPKRVPPQVICRTVVRWLSRPNLAGRPSMIRHADLGSRREPLAWEPIIHRKLPGGLQFWRQHFAAPRPQKCPAAEGHVSGARHVAACHPLRLLRAFKDRPGVFRHLRLRVQRKDLVHGWVEQIIRSQDVLVNNFESQRVITHRFRCVGIDIVLAEIDVVWQDAKADCRDCS
jgi:hypothetical protein